MVLSIHSEIVQTGCEARPVSYSVDACFFFCEPSAAYRWPLTNTYLQRLMCRTVHLNCICAFIACTWNNFTFTSDSSVHFFFSMAQQPNSGLGSLIVEVSISPTDAHTHIPRTPLNEWAARLRSCCLHNTKQTEETNIHARSRIRTRSPSNRVAAELRRRPRGHRDRPSPIQLRDFSQVE
jgi:hypothetical protein